MDKIENIFESLTESINQSINDFSKCKDLIQKKTHAEIIKTLCESMGVFFQAMNNSSLDFYPDYEEDYMDDEDIEDYHEYSKHNNKSKNKKKSKNGEIPF